MELFLLYLWFKLDALIGFFVGASIVLAIFCLVMTIHIALDSTDTYYTSKEDFPNRKKLRNRFVLAFFACVLSAIAIPSSKETAVLVIASYASDLAKSPEGVKAWTLIRKTANNMLDEALKEPVKK